MIVCFSNHILDSYYYKLGLEKIKDQVLNFKANPLDISIPELKSATTIIFLNSIKEKRFLEICKKIIKSKTDAKIFYTSTNYKNVKKMNSIKPKAVQYLKLEDIEESILASDHKNQRDHHFIAYPSALLKLIDRDTVKFPIYVKRNMNYVENEKDSDKDITIYIDKKDKAAFIEVYQKSFKQKVRKLREKQTQIDILDSMHENVLSLGVQEETIELTNMILSEIIRDFGKSKKIIPYIKDLYKDQNFVATHSLASAYILTELLEEHYKELPQLKKKMVFASLIHDLALKKRYQKFEKIKLEEYIEDDELYIDYHSHSTNICKVLDSKKSLFDEDVKNVILYHHETPTGDGPNKINAHGIKPLSALFNTVHEFACLLEKYDAQEALFIMDSQEYSTGMYKKPFMMLMYKFSREQSKQ